MTIKQPLGLTVHLGWQ